MAWMTIAIELPGGFAILVGAFVPLVAISNGREVNGLHTYRNQVPLTAWAAAIVRHKVADFLRARAHREALHDPIEDDTERFAQSETASRDATSTACSNSCLSVGARRSSMSGCTGCRYRR